MAREGEKKEKGQEEICGTCLFFGPKGKKGTKEEIAELEDGVCKLYPPKDTEKLDAHPRVSKGNWCNKYGKRPSGKGRIETIGVRADFGPGKRVDIPGSLG